MNKFSAFVRNIAIACASVSIVAMSSGTLVAGGFQLSEAGARAVAMSFAVVAEPADATTIFYNPAGMTYLKPGFSASAGLSWIVPLARVTGPTNLNQFNTTDYNFWSFPIPHAFLAYNMPESNLAFGVGVFVPFGLGTNLDPNWSGRNLAIRTYLQTVTINPNIAYSFFDKKVSVAAGLTYSMGLAQLRQKVTGIALFQGAPEPVLNLEGTGTAVSWNAGVMIKPTDKLSIGVAYRHNIDMKYTGEAKFSIDPEGTQPLTAPLSALFQNGGGGTGINLPFDLRTGIGYKFSEKFTAELGFDLVGWSSYDTLRINFDRLPGNPSVAGVRNNPRNYKNAIALRLGTEYTVNDDLKLRFGTYYDQVAVDQQFTQPFLPDANRVGISGGFGLKLNDKLSMDFGYLFIYGFQREVKGSEFNFDAIYNAWAHVSSLSFHYRF